MSNFVTSKNGIVKAQFIAASFEQMNAEQFVRNGNYLNCPVYFTANQNMTQYNAGQFGLSFKSTHEFAAILTEIDTAMREGVFDAAVSAHFGDGITCAGRYFQSEKNPEYFNVDYNKTLSRMNFSSKIGTSLSTGKVTDPQNDLRTLIGGDNVVVNSSLAFTMCICVTGTTYKVYVNIAEVRIGSIVGDTKSLIGSGGPRHIDLSNGVDGNFTFLANTGRTNSAQVRYNGRYASFHFKNMTDAMRKEDGSDISVGMKQWTPGKEYPTLNVSFATPQEMKDFLAALTSAINQQISTDGELCDFLNLPKNTPKKKDIRAKLMLPEGEFDTFTLSIDDKTEIRSIKGGEPLTGILATKDNHDILNNVFRLNTIIHELTFDLSNLYFFDKDGVKKVGYKFKLKTCVYEPSGNSYKSAFDDSDDDAEEAGDDAGEDDAAEAEA
jgi:hypothetical protein